MKQAFAIACMTVMMALPARGQWMQTAGPEGGPVSSLAADDSATIAIVQQDVYRNRGTTWEQVGTLDGVGTRNVWIVSGEPLLLVRGTLLANTRAGVLRSTDYGSTWSEADIEGDIFTDGEYFYAERSDSLFRSSDGGASWPLVAVLPMLTSTPLIHKGSMIALSGFFGDALIRSTNGGARWDTLPADLPPHGSGGILLSAGPDALYATLGNRIYRSVDGGLRWNALPEGPEGVFARLVADGEDLWLSTTEGLFHFSGGTWREIDIARTNHFIPTRNGLLAGTPEGAFTIDRTTLRGTPLGRMPSRQSVGTMGIAGRSLMAVTTLGLHRTTDGGEHWERVSDLQPWTFIPYGNSTFMIAGGLHRSTDDGATWQSYTSRLGNVGEDITSLAVAGTDLYAGISRTFGEHGVTVWNSGGVLRSTDGGESWSEVNAGFPFRGGVAVPVVDVIETNHGMLASTLEGVFRSTNRGGSWSRAMTGLPNDDANPIFGNFLRRAGQVYLRTGRGIYQLSDAAVSWSLLTPAIPEDDGYRTSGSLWSTGDHFYTDSYKWLGGTTFAYRLHRFDGTTWEDITATQPEGVQLQAFVKFGTELYAGSISHGVWKMQIPSSVSSGTMPSLAVETATYPNPARDEATVRFTLPAATHVRMMLVDQLGQEMPVYEGSLEAGAHQREIDLRSFPAGTYLLRLHAGDASADARIVKIP